MAGGAIASIYAGVVKDDIGKVGRAMASAAILAGWQVISEFADTDHIVVARIAATDKRRAGMVKCAGTKRPWRMANTAIFTGLHVSMEQRGKWLAACFSRQSRVAARCRAIIYNTRMVDGKCWGKAFGVMAYATV